MMMEAALRRHGFLGAGIDLKMLAECEPRLANALIRPDLLGVGDPTCGWGWQLINLEAQFDSGGADQNVRFQLQQGIIQTDLWVRAVRYTVVRPNAFAGNVLKAQSDYYNQLNPGINFTLTVNSHCIYTISPSPTPLQNIGETFECVCPVGFVLGCDASFDGSITNVRALADDEVPTIVTITFSCVRLPTPYTACGLKEAMARLQSSGLLDEMVADFQDGAGVGKLPPEENG